MSSARWWWRLQLLEWTQAAKDRPVRRAATLLLWWLPCLIGPAVTSLDEATSRKALGFLLSVDVPLTLFLAVGVLLDALGIASRGAENWLWPRAFQPTRVQWLARLRWLVAMRWPAGLVLAALLLGSGTTNSSDLVSELLLMAVLALMVGGAAVWALARANAGAPTRGASTTRNARGMAALSWVPILESRERFDLKRMTLLSVPALLAAPMGVRALEVAGVLAAFLPAMFVVVVCRESVRTQAFIHRWLPVPVQVRAKLTYWVWRYVALGVVVLSLGTVLWFAPGRRLLVSSP